MQASQTTGSPDFTLVSSSSSVVRNKCKIGGGFTDDRLTWLYISIIIISGQKQMQNRWRVHRRQAHLTGTICGKQRPRSVLSATKSIVYWCIETLKKERTRSMVAASGDYRPKYRNPHLNRRYLQTDLKSDSWGAQTVTHINDFSWTFLQRNQSNICWILIRNALTNLRQIYCPNFSKIYPSNGRCLVNFNPHPPKICCGQTNWGVGATKAVSWSSSGVVSQGFQGVNRRVHHREKYSFEEGGIVWSGMAG